MSLGHDATTPTTFTALLNHSWSHTAGGDYVRVCLGWTQLLSLASTRVVTYGGVAMTSLGFAQVAPTDDGGSWAGFAEIFELIAPALGAQTVAITWTGNVAYGSGAAISYTGVHQATPSGTLQTATGSGTAPTVNVSSISGDWIGDALFHYGATTASTYTPAYTSRANSYGFDAAGTHYYFGCAQDTATSGTVAMSWTAPTSKTWAIAAAAIYPAVNPLNRAVAYHHRQQQGMAA